MSVSRFCDWLIRRGECARGTILSASVTLCGTGRRTSCSQLHSNGPNPGTISVLGPDGSTVATGQPGCRPGFGKGFTAYKPINRHRRLSTGTKVGLSKVAFKPTALVFVAE